MRTCWFTPWLYVIPALFVLAFFLIYPSLNTLFISFFGPASEKFVGFANYIYCFTNEVMLTSFRNNLLWVALFVPVTVF